MDTIIEPVPVELIKAELTQSKKLQDTNKGHNELYIVTWHDSPNVVTEIGRLREVAFRQAGGSTGNAIDLDEYDKMEKPYKQLIVWDPDNEVRRPRLTRTVSPFWQVRTNSAFRRSLSTTICHTPLNSGAILSHPNIRVPETAQIPFSPSTTCGTALWPLL